MLQNDYDTMLELVSVALFDHQSDAITGFGNDALADELLANAVLPIALSGARAVGAVEFCNKWNRRSNAIVGVNMAVSYEHTELHELLTANNIPYVILKGAASASYYPTPILRTMGDVDFLVKECDLKRTGELLESIGFQPEKDTGSIHIGYHRENSTWEMHRSVNGMPSGKMGAVVQACLLDTIDTAVEYDEGNGVIRIPDSFHHGLILLLHTASHLTSEGVGLRHLCDWAVFVNHFSDEQFAGIFENKLKACGLWRFAQLLTLVCMKYLHVPAKVWAGEAGDELLERMICDILSGGNFGKKDEDRYRQIKYISNRGEHTVDEKPAVCQLWNTISRKAKAENKTWLGVVADYAKMVMQGKRKMDRIETIQRAGERKSLYAEFHLFDTDIQ